MASVVDGEPGIWAPSDPTNLRIWRSGYIDHRRSDYEHGAWKCPTALAQIMPQCRMRGLFDNHYGINRYLRGQKNAEGTTCTNIGDLSGNLVLVADSHIGWYQTGYYFWDFLELNPYWYAYDAWPLQLESLLRRSEPLRRSRRSHGRRFSRRRQHGPGARVDLARLHAALECGGPHPAAVRPSKAGVADRASDCPTAGPGRPILRGIPAERLAAAPIDISSGIAGKRMALVRHVSSVRRRDFTCAPRGRRVAADSGNGRTS